MRCCGSSMRLQSRSNRSSPGPSGMGAHGVSNSTSSTILRPIIRGASRSTPSTVNDVQVGKTLPIETGATYVFDKAYCNYAWWTRIHEADSYFVTRRKTNAAYKLVRRRPLRKTTGDGFKILDDAEVKLATQGHARRAIPMRRVRVKRDDRT